MRPVAIDGTPAAAVQLDPPSVENQAAPKPEATAWFLSVGWNSMSVTNWFSDVAVQVGPPARRKTPLAVAAKRTPPLVGSMARRPTNRASPPPGKDRISRVQVLP